MRATLARGIAVILAAGALCGCPDNTPPPTPEGLKVESASTNDLKISWTISTWPVTCQLFQDTDAGGAFTAKVYDGGGTRFTVASLVPGSTYWYKVQATNSAGSSALSEAVAGTTLALVVEGGALDGSFLGSGAGSSGGSDPGVHSVVLQQDGKILLGGGFTSFDGSSCGRIVRLNADGSLDAPFLAAGTGADGDVAAIAVQPDDRILIGGSFLSCNGTPRSRIARLNADGSLDASFDPGAGASGGVGAIVVQPDGRILVGGAFDTYDSISRNGLARLNADGSLDPGFSIGTGVGGMGVPTVYAIALQQDGKILVGGDFAAFDGISRNRIARLNTDGTLDPSFGGGSGAGGVGAPLVCAIALQPDGKSLVGGRFSTFHGASRSGISRLYPDGSVDPTFDPGAGAGGTINPPILQSVVLQPDGKILIGGAFLTYGGALRRNLARLNTDGSLDAAFLKSKCGPDNTVYCIAVQTDGKILLGGSFDAYNGAARSHVARIQQ